MSASSRWQNCHIMVLWSWAAPKLFLMSNNPSRHCGLDLILKCLEWNFCFHLEVLQLLQTVWVSLLHIYWTFWLCICGVCKTWTYAMLRFVRHTNICLHLLDSVTRIKWIHLKNKEVLCITLFSAGVTCSLVWTEPPPNGFGCEM